jgi:hypothetical protein
MSLEALSDDSITLYYDQIRRLADDDRRHTKHFTVSPSIRLRAEKLREEMVRRRLRYTPIVWPTS